LHFLFVFVVAVQVPLSRSKQIALPTTIRGKSGKQNREKSNKIKNKVEI